MKKSHGPIIDSLVEKQIDKMLKRGQTIREIFSTCNPMDMLIIERMAYFKYGIPWIAEYGRLTEDQQSNFIIQMYSDLKQQGKIHQCETPINK